MRKESEIRRTKPDPLRRRDSAARGIPNDQTRNSRPSISGSDFGIRNSDLTLLSFFSQAGSFAHDGIAGLSSNLAKIASKRDEFASKELSPFYRQETCLGMGRLY